MAKRNNDNTDQPKKKTGTVAPAPRKVSPKKPRTSNGSPKNRTPAIVQADNSALNKPEQPLAENKMEVHHHPQLDHKPKPWKEYLLEGFMIFIAVMMGFVAENIREDITNHEHATHLTAQLVQDLQADTTKLNKIIDSEIEISKSNDTLINLLQQPLPKVDFKQIQRSIYQSHSFWPFYPSSGAINAIKNELHLKQFSNSDIISYISTYERLFNLLRTVQDVTLQYQRTYIDPFMFDHFMPANLNAVFAGSSPKDAQMRNLTQEDLTHLAACMVLIKTNTNELVRDNKALKEEATALLKYVNKTYHPEN
jgi:hypothetical protein